MRMRDAITTALEVVGAGLILAAAVLVSLPAALAVGGVLLIAASWLVSRR